MKSVLIPFTAIPLGILCLIALNSQSQETLWPLAVVTSAGLISLGLVRHQDTE